MLLWKIADDSTELQKAGTHMVLEEHVISALFLVQVPIAALGIFIGYGAWRAIMRFALRHAAFGYDRAVLKGNPCTS
jgi:hypothetical protein